jgi:hypothetical protein
MRLRRHLGQDVTDALAAAQQASEDTLYVTMWALPELIEAAVRSGNTQTASGALERLAETTQAAGTDYGLGVEARSGALLSDGAAADGLYRSGGFGGRSQLPMSRTVVPSSFGAPLPRRRGPARWHTCLLPRFLGVRLCFS